MKTITGITNTFLTGHSVEWGYSAECIENLAFSTSEMKGTDWVKVGQAEIIVHLNETKDITQAQLDMLHEAEQKLQADTEMKLNIIRGKIQSLLAIEYQL